jgi:hypothetical protein
MSRLFRASAWRRSQAKSIRLASEPGAWQKNEIPRAAATRGNDSSTIPQLNVFTGHNIGNFINYLKTTAYKRLHAFCGTNFTFGESL